MKKTDHPKKPMTRALVFCGAVFLIGAAVLPAVSLITARVEDRAFVYSVPVHLLFPLIIGVLCGVFEYLNARFSKKSAGNADAEERDAHQRKPEEEPEEDRKDRENQSED